MTDTLTDLACPFCDWTAPSLAAEQEAIHADGPTVLRAAITDSGTVLDHLATHARRQG